VLDRPPLELAAFFELLPEEPKLVLLERPLFALLFLELDLLKAFRPPPFELLDRDEFLEGAIVSAAAPTAPTAAPAAAPDSISPATSITLSTNLFVVDLRALPYLGVGEDLTFFFDVPELDLLAIVAPFVRN